MTGHGIIRPSGGAVLVAVLCSLLPVRAAAQEEATGDSTAGPLAEAREAFRTGQYTEGIRLYRRATREDGTYPDAHIGLSRILSEVGRYEDAEEHLRETMADNPGPAELSNSLGEVLLRTGDLEGAEEAFQNSIAGGAADHLRAELNLAELMFQRGERTDALTRFDRFIDVYNENPALSSEELTCVGLACRYLGRLNPDLFRDALRAFDEASEADPLNLEPALMAGFLFLEKYNSEDAGATFDEILRINPSHPMALLGKSMQLHFDGSGQSFEMVAEALNVNPNMLEARTFLGELLLGVEAFKAAAAEAEKALEVNPVYQPALRILAAAQYLNGDERAFKDTRDRIVALNPTDGEFYMKLAQACVLNRLYREGVEFAAEAVENDPELWHAYGVLGINQLRTGDIEIGKANIEVSFVGDPYNIWNKNTLDLLDTLPDYVISESDRFQAVVHGSESELLAPMVLELAEQSYSALSSRYEYEPETPIRIELYPNEADFSVRTVGLAGLGALGVCFGPVVALDSPSARDVGSFNWGSTLWHELTHAVTLGMTDHRIPRWFSEGLSVFEERNSMTGWGEEMSIPFLRAYQQERILGISMINNGFMRPTYPGQVQVSYFQASLICDWISEEYGFDKILEMLEGYRRRLSTTEILREVFGTDPAEFDGAFGVYVGKRFARQLEVLEGRQEDNESIIVVEEEMVRRAEENPDDFEAHLIMGRRRYQQDRLEEAIEYLEHARDLLPEYSGSDGPYAYLASIYRQQDRYDEAIEALRKLTSLNETDFGSHITLAELLEEKGEMAEAAGVLRRALYIYPLEPELHVRLAEAYDALGEYTEAVTARRSVLALDPVDRVEALYQLALALYKAGERTESKRFLLQALDAAPNYEAALDLLLKLQPPPQQTHRKETDR